jgi:hypothetical protein
VALRENQAQEQHVEDRLAAEEKLRPAAGLPDGGAGVMLGLQRSAGNAAVSRFLTRTGSARLHRQDNFTPATPPTFTPPTATPADYAKLSWEQLLPTAHGARPIATVNLQTPDNRWSRVWGSGKDPTLEYAPDKDIKVDPATVATRGGASTTPQADADEIARQAALAAAQDAAVAKIVGARGLIPARKMGRSPNNNAGWDYNPDKDPDAVDYNAWAKTALPTGVKADDWNWQVFREIQKLEGQAGRVTTFDKTLSIGAGFSTSGGQTQAILGKTFDLLPEVKAVAFDAGLIVSSSGPVTVVDTDKKWILHDQDADNYLQTQTQLLSLLVDVSQGAVPVAAAGGGTGPPGVSPDEQSKQRQTFLDVQWQQFLAGTLAGISGRVQGWPLDSAVLAAHAKHALPATFPYSFWESHPSSDLGTMVKTIFATAGDAGANICNGKYANFPHQ